MKAFLTGVGKRATKVFVNGSFVDSFNADTKANTNGVYVNLTAGYADNLTPYSEDSGVTQSVPFINQGTGCANGTAQADTGSFIQLKEKRGNMVVVNQLVQNGTFESTSGWAAVRGNISASNNKLLFEITELVSDYSACRIARTLNNAIPANHKILVCMTFDALYSGTARISLAGGDPNTLDAADFTVITGTNLLIAVVNTTTARQTLYCGFNPVTAGYQVGDTVKFSNVFIRDLSQWFGSTDNIPADLLSHPENFFRYYQGDLSYNAGVLVNSNARYLTNIGRNIWDEEWELGVLQTDGTLNSDTSRRTSSFIRVEPNTAYYIPNPCKNGRYAYYDIDKNVITVNVDGFTSNVITTPSNACYLRISFNVSYGTTYNHDITISLYYPGESGYDQYYPYEVLTVVDTGSEDLGAFDTKDPDGTWHKNTLPEIDLGNLEWTKTTGQSGSIIYFQTAITGAKLPSSNSVVANIRCSKYAAESSEDVYTGTKTNCICLNTSGYIRVSDTSLSSGDALAFKTAVTGVKLQVELNTPTTEQGTPFIDQDGNPIGEFIPCDNFGSMFVSAENFNGIPMGNEIFYPVNYKAYLDSLVNHTDGNATSIALKNDITDAALNARGYYKLQDLSSGITDLLSGIIVVTKKLTKQGNVVTLSFVGQNDTGSTIAANTALFKLPSGAYDINYNVLSPCVANSQVVFCRILYNASGSLNLNEDWANGTTLFINVSFVV